MTIDEKLTDIFMRVTRIEEQNKTIFNTLKAVNNAINGNGQPGLVERVTTLEEKTKGPGRVFSVVSQIATFLLALLGAIKAFLGGNP